MAGRLDGGWLDAAMLVGRLATGRWKIGWEAICVVAGGWKVGWMSDGSW